MPETNQYSTFEQFVRSTYQAVPVKGHLLTTILIIGHANASPYIAARATNSTLEYFMVPDLVRVTEARVLDDAQRFYRERGFNITAVEHDSGIVRMQKDDKKYRALISVDDGVLEGACNLNFSLDEIQ